MRVFPAAGARLMGREEQAGLGRGTIRGCALVEALDGVNFAMPERVFDLAVRLGDAELCGARAVRSHPDVAAQAAQLEAAGSRPAGAATLHVKRGQPLDSLLEQLERVRPAALE
jgi:hypothetical protein